MVVRDVLVKWNISTTNSHHSLVTFALNDLLLSSNEIDLASNVDNWNGYIQFLHQSFDFFF